MGNIIKKQVKKSDEMVKQITTSELNKGLKRLRNKGFKPFIKGKGSGGIKLGFE